MREGERERERQRKTDTDTYIVAQQEFIQIREKVLYHKGMTQKHVNTLTRTKNLVSEPVYIPYIIYMKNLRFSVRIPARIKRCDPDQTIICPHDSVIFYCWSACLLFNPF